MVTRLNLKSLYIATIKSILRLLKKWERQSYERKIIVAVCLLVFLGLTIAVFTIPLEGNAASFAINVATSIMLIPFSIFFIDGLIEREARRINRIKSIGLKFHLVYIMLLLAHIYKMPHEIEGRIRQLEYVDEMYAEVKKFLKQKHEKFYDFETDDMQLEFLARHLIAIDEEIKTWLTINNINSLNEESRRKIEALLSEINKIKVEVKMAISRGNNGELQEVVQSNAWRIENEITNLWNAL